MKSKKLVLLLPTLVLGVFVLMGMLVKSNSQPNIIRKQHGGYDLELVRNSKSLSQAIAINASGSIIGAREVEDESGVTLSLRSFFCGGDLCKDMPIPEGFTNVEAVAISDTDKVIGFASRTIGHEDGSLLAVVWDPRTDSIEFLPAAEGDSACQAQSISSDGSRIAGYTTGPERLRPAVWSREDARQVWSIVVLETVMDYNPYLMSSTLQIHPDGKRVAGCCTEQILPGNIIDSSLYAWQENQGKWERSYLHTEQIYVRDMNAQGALVGSLLGPEGRLPCFVSPAGELQRLKLLESDTAGEARGINQHAQIVGWSDRPHDPEGGPQACTWKPDGSVTRLSISEIPYAMVYGINDSGQIAGMLTVTVSEPNAERKADGQVEESALAFRGTPRPQ